MHKSYFPGANTPRGFVSRFAAMLQDPRVQRRIYIKGGAGCGKSTLMRRIARLDEDSELGLCSSDPDSLDAALLPKAGLCICDATAPHVCEPELCGVDGEYLDLGRFYDAAALRERAPLLQGLRQANQACYDVVTQALQAAQALYRQREALVEQPLLAQRIQSAADSLTLPEGGGTGTVRRLFFTGVTPAGCLLCDGLLRREERIYQLHDSYHLAGRYLRCLQNRALAAGLEVTAGMSPLFPDGDPEQLWIPQAGIALVRQSSQFGTISGAITLDLDPLASPSSQARREAAYLRELTGQILDTAVRQLAKAKAIHDELEAALHPYVDFDDVTRTADGLADDIQRLM